MADHAPEVRPTGPARKPGVLANVLAIVGFIILIIIVIWGLLHIISLSTPWFSGLFNESKKPQITVTAPAQVNAQVPFVISWKYSSPNQGTFAVLYQCVQGLKISVEGNAVPCGAAFALGNATATASLVPTLTGTTSVATVITVLYIPSASGTTGPEASGSATVRIVAAAPTENPPAVVNPKPTTPVPTPSPKPVSAADLSVRIIAVGVIDPYTGAFVARAPYSTSDVSAVQFDIQNVGGGTSGSYTFTANIPTTQPYTFSSQVQPSLAPGSHVVNTLRFSPAVNGTFSVQIHGSDSRTANNFASIGVTGAHQQPSYPYPYQY